MSLFRKEVIDARADRLHGEVVLSLPWANHFLALLLVTIAVAAVAWFSLGTYTRVERADGILVTDLPTAKIYAPRQGIATSIYVEEGALVDKDTPIVMIDLDVRNQEGAATIAASRQEVSDQLRLAEAQITLAHQTFDVEEVRLQASLASGQHQLAVLEAQLETQDQIVLSQQQMFDQLEKIVADGYISRREYERQRQTLLASRQSQLMIRQQLIDLHSNIDAVRTQLSSVEVARSRESAILESQVSAFRQRHMETSGAQAVLIKAPIAGRVTAIQVGVGQSVRPDTPMLVIVPAGADLLAEIYAPTRAIGLLRVGQESRLQFHAFPYQRFGTAQGKVASISRVILDPRELTAPLELSEPVYKVMIVLDSQAMEARGDVFPLHPGMTLTANIVLERQSFLDWLLRPLKTVANRTR